MTPEELHKRILLHELRTILLDDSREGTPIPNQVRSLIQESPHDPNTYLVLIDEELDPELAELCRIQCELIVYDFTVPACSSHKYGTHTRIKLRPQNHHHPFENDLSAGLFLQSLSDTPRNSTQHELLWRRWQIVQKLYPPLESRVPKEKLRGQMSPKQWNEIIGPYIIEAGFDNPGLILAPTEETDGSEIVYLQPRTRKLGRTTRMLTDVLRYCCLNEKKRVLIRTPPEQTTKIRTRFSELTEELAGQEADEWTVIDGHTAFGNAVRFSTVERWPFDVASDVTFTDHAAHQGNQP